VPVEDATFGEGIAPGDAGGGKGGEAFALGVGLLEVPVLVQRTTGEMPPSPLGPQVVLAKAGG
jgi:hypothetical protein